MFASHYLKYFCNTLIQNIIAESDDSHCYLVDSNIVRGCYLQIQCTRVYFFEKQYSDYRGVLISRKPITWFFACPLWWLFCVKQNTVIIFCLSHFPSLPECYAWNVKFIIFKFHTVILTREIILRNMCYFCETAPMSSSPFAA